MEDKTIKEMIEQLKLYLESSVFNDTEKTAIQNVVNYERSVHQVYKDAVGLFYNRTEKEPLPGNPAIKNVILVDFKEKRILGYN